MTNDNPIGPINVRICTHTQKKYSMYYNNNKSSWKDFSVKASKKRREDISKYFHKNAKKNILLVNVKNKK